MYVICLKKFFVRILFKPISQIQCNIVNLKSEFVYLNVFDYCNKKTKESLNVMELFLFLNELLKFLSF